MLWVWNRSLVSSVLREITDKVGFAKSLGQAHSHKAASERDSREQKVLLVVARSIKLVIVSCCPPIILHWRGAKNWVEWRPLFCILTIPVPSLVPSWKCPSSCHADGFRELCVKFTFQRYSCVNENGLGIGDLGQQSWWKLIRDWGWDWLQLPLSFWVVWYVAMDLGTMAVI